MSGSAKTRSRLVWRLAAALEDRNAGLPEPVLELGEVLIGQVAELDRKIDSLDKKLHACVRQDEEAAYDLPHQQAG